MALEQYTLNKVFDLFKSIVAQHEMLNGFGIEEDPTRGYDKENGEELSYPYCFINPMPIRYQMNTSGAGIAAKEYTIKVFVADKYYANAKNGEDILSDTEQILSDLVQWVSTNRDLRKFQLRADIRPTPVRHQTISDVHGWEADFVIRVPYKLCYNHLPIDSNISTC